MAAHAPGAQPSLNVFLQDRMMLLRMPAPSVNHAHAGVARADEAAPRSSPATSRSSLRIRRVARRTDLQAQIRRGACRARLVLLQQRERGPARLLRPSVESFPA